MSRQLWLVLLVVLAGAAALRWPLLGARPLHNDEAVNAVKFGQLWDKGVYRYDPNEHHGPSLYYATWALAKVTGTTATNQFSDARLRWAPALFGLGLIALLPLVASGLGRRATGWAALLTAVSPAMVFYGNYFIHEPILVFAAFLALAAGWRYWQSRKIGWAMVAGAAGGLMHATKETFVLTLLAVGLSLMGGYAWNRCVDATAPSSKPRAPRWRHLLAGLAAWLCVAAVLLTSFFTNWRGLTDSVATYLPWAQRAAGESPHLHPWSFYLERLLFFKAGNGPVWTEAVVACLAIVGAASGFIRRDLGRGHAGFIRFLAFYTLALLVIYSAIPYKTPWCLLGFWHGAILLGGVGAAWLLRRIRTARRPAEGASRAGFGGPFGLGFGVAAAGLLLVCGLGHLGWQAWRGGTTFAADRRNPYVYSQTSPNLLQLVDRVEALGRAHPDGYRMLLKVICPDSDYWPLPWYLRRFQRIGYWDAMPPDPAAPVMIVAAPLNARLDEGDAPRLMIGYTQLRPEVFLETYVDLNLWKQYLEKNPPRLDHD